VLVLEKIEDDSGTVEAACAPIGQTFPLERASDVHAAIEARTTLGKTLLVDR